MDMKINSWLSFRIGTEIFAANAMRIQSIIEFAKITKVPETPEYLLGILNLCGEVLPVIDSRIKLNLPISEITANTCIIVLEVFIEDSEKKIGLLVEEVLEVIEIDSISIQETPSLGLSFHSSLLTGIYRVDDKFVMLLDINKLILTDIPAPLLSAV